MNMRNLEVLFLRRRLAMGVLMIATVALASPGGAQKARRFEKEAVIALVDDEVIAGGTVLVHATKGTTNTYWIIRYPDGKQRNIIALRRSTASPETLLNGILALQSLKASSVEKPGKAQLLSFAAAQQQAVDPETRALFERLGRAGTFKVRALGKTQGLVIRLARESDS